MRSEWAHAPEAPPIRSPPVATHQQLLRCHVACRFQRRNNVRGQIRADEPPKAVITRSLDHESELRLLPGRRSRWRRPHSEMHSIRALVCCNCLPIVARYSAGTGSPRQFPPVSSSAISEGWVVPSTCRNNLRDVILRQATDHSINSGVWLRPLCVER